MSKIKLRNLLNHDLIISVPEMRLRREMRPNQAITIDSEKLDEAMSYNGVANLFRYGYVRIETDAEDIDTDVFEDLGIDLEENKKLYSMNELKELMEKGTDVELEEVLKDTSEERKQIVLAAALATDGLTFAKMNMISEYTGENIIALRKRKQDLTGK